MQLIHRLLRYVIEDANTGVRKMNSHSLHMKSVIYDAACRMFRARVSFLDTRGTYRSHSVAVSGRPDWDFNQIVSALVRGISASGRIA